jgi:hypothetical protein
MLEPAVAAVVRRQMIEAERFRTPTVLSRARYRAKR